MFKRILFFLIMIIIVVSCSKEKGNKSNISELTIIYSGNIGGRYNPCGCRTPTGGLAKRSVAIKKILSENPNTLIFDSGSLLFPSNRHEKGFEYLDRRSAGLTSEIVRDIGINVVNVGSNDLVDGVDSLKAYFREPGSPIALSSNIIYKKTGELCFQPDTVLTVDGLRIGVFGISEYLRVDVNAFEDSSLTVIDPVVAANKEVEKLKKESDFIVGLFFAENDAIMKYMKGVQGINVIISSHTGNHSPNDHSEQVPLYNINNTIITSIPDGGRVIGRLDFIFVNKSFICKEYKQLLAYKFARVKDENIKPPRESVFSNYFIKLNDEVSADSLIQKRIDVVETELKNYAVSKGLKRESDLAEEDRIRMEQADQKNKKKQ